MTGTVADLLAIVNDRTAFPKTFVEQRARNLQAGGRLRVTAGSKQPPATPRDLVNILFALAASVARRASIVASDFEMLERLGGCEPTERRAGDFLERLIARAWAGHHEHPESIITLSRHPVPQVDITGPAYRNVRFYPTGQLMALSGRDRVRTAIDIPIKIIAAIGGDLGHKACAYAR